MIVSILATVILILDDEVLDDGVIDDGAKRLYISELLDGFGPPERAGLQVL